MLELQNHLNKFTKMHDEFIRDWNHTMSSGDTSSVEKMSDDYYVAFFNSGSEKPIIFNKQEAINGMEQSVKHFLGLTRNLKTESFD